MTNAPDWIRTAHHDMVTHNIADSTGGLDASIRFAEEQSRPENAGDDLYKPSHFTYVRGPGDPTVLISSPIVAELIATGAVNAIENCGGPRIAFRSGRINSAKLKTANVPEPQQDLDSHIAAFTRQGFTQTGMIFLIAYLSLTVYKHTSGGVEHSAFPDTVPNLNDPNNSRSVAHFDSTFVNFDNNFRATEYNSGTTQNPLVVGANDTTNSDKRISTSEGNIRQFARPLQIDVCNTFARMLDTVPSGVEHRAGILRMHFTVDSKLEDQGSIGFAMQDGVVFSTPSCLTSSDPLKRRFDIAVLNDFNPTRVFLEREVKDSVKRMSVEETDLVRPAQPVAAWGHLFALEH
ncbi:heme peroxidase [Mycena capillaripes]|nr:heme peroxidase [Mycena capillaripes]